MKKSFYVVFILFMVACAPKREENPGKDEKIAIKVPVLIENTAFREFSHFIEVTGVVEAEYYAVISSEISGQIKKIHVREGQLVKKGQLMVSLNSKVTESTIAEVKTGLVLAKKIYEKQKELWEQNIGSEIQYLEAKTSKESSENRLKTLQAQLEMARIKAPFEGVVEEIYSKEGELAIPGLQLVYVINLSKLKVVAEVSETYLPNIKKGDMAILEFSSYPDIKLKIPINRTGNVINKQNRTFKVEFNFENPESLLKPNILTTVKLNDYYTDSALIVPSIIIKQDMKGSYLYVASGKGADSYAKKIYIEKGRSYQDKTMVLQGLEKDQMIIISGYNKVYDGIAIEIKN